MEANEYQRLAHRTLANAAENRLAEHEITLVGNALGLAAEAGEVSDLIKKAVFQRHELDREELVKELGDVLWCVSALCTVIKVPLGEVMSKNLEKLSRRYPDGFSSERSKNRAENQSAAKR